MALFFTMLKRVNLFFVILLGAGLVVSQPTVGGIAGKGMDMNTTFGGFIGTMDLTDYSPVGNTYLFGDWSQANVTLKSGGVLANIPIMVNLLENEIDLKDNELIRTFSIEQTRFIDFKFSSDSAVRYINHLEFNYPDSTPLIGLLRIVTDSEKWNLVERKYVKVFKSTYIQALDSGPKQDRYEVSSDWLLLRNNVLFQIPNRLCLLGQTLNLNDTTNDELCRFSKSNKLSSRSEPDLRQLTIWLNNLQDQ